MKQGIKETLRYLRALDKDIYDMISLMWYIEKPANR